MKPTNPHPSTLTHIITTPESVEYHTEKSLTKTLVFQPQPNGERLLSEAYHEARWVYNQTIRLATSGMDWNDISSRLENEVGLVKVEAVLNLVVVERGSFHVVVVVEQVR